MKQRRFIIRLPLECWTEILEWLDEPEEIDRISLVKPGFASIFERKLNRKFGEKKKEMPDLHFDRRQYGIAKLCKLVEGESNYIEVSIPIAVVPPPDYLMPPKEIFVQ